MSEIATHPVDIDRMCRDKHRYDDKKAAQTALNALKPFRGRHGRPQWLRSYPCPICRGWHLTKGKPRRSLDPR